MRTKPWAKHDRRHNYPGENRPCPRSPPFKSRNIAQPTTSHPSTRSTCRYQEVSRKSQALSEHMAALPKKTRMAQRCSPKAQQAHRCGNPTGVGRGLSHERYLKEVLWPLRRLPSARGLVATCRQKCDHGDQTHNRHTQQQHRKLHVVQLAFGECDRLRPPCVQQRLSIGGGCHVAQAKSREGGRCASSSKTGSVSASFASTRAMWSFK